MPFCKSCGHKVEAADRFCEECGIARSAAGAPVAGPAAAPSPAAAPAPARDHAGAAPATTPMRKSAAPICPDCGAAVAVDSMDYHRLHKHGTVYPASSSAAQVCPDCGTEVAAGSLEYHRLHKHRAAASAPATSPQSGDSGSWSRTTGWVAAGLLLVAVVAIAIAQAAPSDGRGGTTATSAGFDSESASDGEPDEPAEGATDLELDLVQLEEMRQHTSAWNASAGPLVEAIVDPDVSIEETVEVADRELPAMKQAADAIVAASLTLNDPEISRLVGAIGRNYQQKYVATRSLVDAVEQQDDDAQQAAGTRLDELVTVAQSLARELVAYVRQQGEEFDLEVEGPV